MNRFTIYCTEEQTRKAFELGAPIIQTHANPYSAFVDRYPMRIWVSTNDEYVDKGYVLAIPTTEQMIGWLETIFKEVNIQEFANFWEYNIYFTDDDLDILHCEHYNSRQEATIAAIDAALNYLVKAKEG